MLVGIDRKNKLSLSQQYIYANTETCANDLLVVL